MTEIDNAIAVIDANLSMIPHHCREGVRAYLVQGRPTGGFLSAIFANDLRLAMAKTDDMNKGRIQDYLDFLCMYAPAKAHGSLANFGAWLKQGGLGGLR